MPDIIKNYASAIIAGNSQKIASTFSHNVKVKPPGTNEPHTGAEKTSTMLSTAVTVITDFKLSRSFNTDTSWSAILFEGLIDGTPIQIIDNVHLNENQLIDQIDIFMRPACMGRLLFERVTAEMERRPKR